MSLRLRWTSKEWFKAASSLPLNSEYEVAQPFYILCVIFCVINRFTVSHGIQAFGGTVGIRGYNQGKNLNFPLVYTITLLCSPTWVRMWEEKVFKYKSFSFLLFWIYYYRSGTTPRAWRDAAHVAAQASELFFYFFFLLFWLIRHIYRELLFNFDRSDLETLETVAQKWLLHTCSCWMGVYSIYKLTSHSKPKTQPNLFKLSYFSLLSLLSSSAAIIC